MRAIHQYLLDNNKPVIFNPWITNNNIDINRILKIAKDDLE